MIDHARLIAALRDTAAKATEMREVTRPDFAAVVSRPHFNRVDEPTITEEVPAYSVDWIAGRLLGMADTLEAMSADQPFTPSGH